MSHWAELDENNIVIRVLVGDDTNGEEAAGDFIIEHLGGRWIQTSYNSSIRKNFAGIGDIYDEVRDAFIAPEPENHAGFDETTCQWIIHNP
jgi:hypothetical protein